MLIFLDIDGVLVTTPPWKPCDLLEDGFAKFNSDAVNNLNKIISKTNNALIILTSSHRDRYNNEEWDNIFIKRGVLITLTFKLNPSNKLNRAEEISNYINENNIVDEYLIIDDDKSLHGLSKNIKNRCIVTKSLIGLDENDVDRALQILNGKM